MGAINREDMLELTRRMTLKRNCLDRIAGAYLDSGGFVDGTFNRHFQKLTAKERQEQLEIAKTVLFADTNVKLKQRVFQPEIERAGSTWQMLLALRECGLKNDALLDVFYEMFGEKYQSDSEYGIYLFHGSYDVPLRAADGESLWESEEVYSFLVCAVCQVNGDYVPEAPECGFLFPAFSDRSGDVHQVNVFAAGQAQREMLEKILFA